MLIRYCIFLLFHVIFVSGYNILVVFPHEGKSHQYIFKPVVQGLLQKGHNLTVIMHYGFNIEHNASYREIILHNPRHPKAAGISLSDISNKPIKYIQKTPFHLTIEGGLMSCEAMLSNEKVQELLKSDVKFDLILAEFFNGECYQGFVHRFQVPLVGISSTQLLPWHNERLGNPDNPSYIASMAEPFPTKMNFFQRLVNFIDRLYLNNIYSSYLADNKAIIEKHLRQPLPDLTSMMKNTSLLLVNSHFSFMYPRPLVPQLVEIGGIHIVSKAQKLPSNIEKFINESTHGVIYFSLGSMIKGHTFPQEKREEFLKAFARLPQRVLWKWENETMPGKPDNVMIQKWMPQFDILSHPNVKAFISHGGLLGTTEAVHCGVPMLVMPQYGDQHTNAKAVEANGGGVILYLKEATEEKVYQSLKTILDPEFRGKTKALSERFRDRPMSPMDTAVYWVEYVARHKGAPHMRTAAVDMPLYQYLLLDVIGFLAVVLLTFLYITYKILSLILRALFSKKKVKQN